jgi:hypothetical protein
MVSHQMYLERQFICRLKIEGEIEHSNCRADGTARQHSLSRIGPQRGSARLRTATTSTPTNWVWRAADRING